MKKSFFASIFALLFSQLSAEVTSHTCADHGNLFVRVESQDIAPVLAKVPGLNKLDWSPLAWEDVEPQMIWEQVENPDTWYRFQDINSNFHEDFVIEHANRLGALVGYNAEKKVYETFCSGTIIGSDNDFSYFLGAAHCIRDKNNATGFIKPVGILFDFQKEYSFGEDTGNTRVQHAYSTLTELKNTKTFFEIIKIDEFGWSYSAADGRSDFFIAVLNKGIDTSDRSGTFTAANAIGYFPWESSDNDSSQMPLWAIKNRTGNAQRGWNRVSVQGFPIMKDGKFNYDKATVKKDDPLMVIGHPRDIPTVANAGYLYSFDNETNWSNTYRDHRIVFWGMDIWPGHSGSAILNKYGSTVGIVTWTDCGPSYEDIKNPLKWKEELANLVDPRPVRHSGTSTGSICYWEKNVKSKKLGKEIGKLREYAYDWNCNGKNDFFDYQFMLFSPISISALWDIYNNSSFNNYFDVQPQTATPVYSLNNTALVKSNIVFKPNTFGFIQISGTNVQSIVKDTTNNTFALYDSTGKKLGNILNYPNLTAAETVLSGSTYYLAGGTINGAKNNTVYKIVKSGNS